MSIVFADTGYWIALVNPNDQLHEKAKNVSESIGRFRIVTSEMVLTELLNYFAKHGQHLRNAAVESIQEMRANANVDGVPMTSAQFRDAMKLYSEIQDKEWSITDCSSRLIMQEKGLREALAYDKHFQQMGFRALLREDNTE
jgi:predicted nucleic acid-binding protein